MFRHGLFQRLKALPASEGWPPFLVICDVGHCFEIFADFTEKGKNYAQFPDRQGFRSYLEDLRNLAQSAQARPDQDRRESDARDGGTARQGFQTLEEAKDRDGRRLYDPESVALFLMRCLFTMFAEDVELLPKGCFRDVLKRCVDDPKLFPRLVSQLWEAMDIGGFAFAIERDVQKFNGYLFKNRAVLPLPKEEIGELFAAAKADWKQVEPAIFGTLLEQALNPAERRKLGAHYTPRAYVERLVVATVLEPLRAEWANVQATAEAKRADGDAKGGAKEVEAFHNRLCETKILDPACGTGNFLYVSLELMKRLEGEVLEALASLSDQGRFTGYELKTIDPHQFLGLEVNPRAVAIAELVLWIGYLQWHFRTRGGVPPEPILKGFKTITEQDAVLEWTSRELARDESGRPVERTDSEGNRVEVYCYFNPKRPEWPAADYVVGNPPFVGGKDIRGRMGEGYTQALWAAHPEMNESADFVIYWWDHAAELLTRKGSRLKRFGLVTTNSLRQVFQRRVVERYLNAKKPISLSMAIPDHPWTKATRDAAAVRIAMTVATPGKHDGRLFEVTTEKGLDTDAPDISLRELCGRINSDLTVGADVTSLPALSANTFVASRGMQLMGAGFIVSPSEAVHLGVGRRPGLENHIRPYRNGRDLTGTARNVMVIDLHDLEASEVRARFPEVYQHILENVKECKDENGRPNGRAVNNRESYKQNWWIFGEPRPELRAALVGLPRYIVTVETAKHRTFQFLDADILPDNRLVCFALAEAYLLGILSSRAHVVWTLQTGGTLEDRPIYTKSKCFDPFPFPDISNAGKARISDAAEELDALRKRQLSQHPNLTLTEIYNVVAKLRAGGALDESDEAIKANGLVLIVKELHDEIDRLVSEAYRWPADIPNDEILTRLVALNAERAIEEKRGLIRWLRPDYQRQRAGLVGIRVEETTAEQSAPTLEFTEIKGQKPLFPTGDLERTAAVFHALLQANSPLGPPAVARAFRQGAKVEPAIARVLASLGRLGHAYSLDGKTFALRRAA